MRRPLVTVVLASTLAGCLPPGIDYQQPVYYVPVLPLAAYPPAPFPAYYPTYGYPARGVDPYVAPAEVQFETPSLAVRALAGSSRVSRRATRSQVARSPPRSCGSSTAA